MRSVLIQAGYSHNNETSVWTRRDYTGIAYSDGDEVEIRIASIINNATDLAVLSDELRPHCTDWPSLYHLSGTRANILRPFEADLCGDVLEIGAGCGAITRYLGECGGNVLALEGTPRRAAIARARTRDLNNVTVVSDKFNDFQCDKKFDVVTLIGVLEYANLFTSGTNPTLSLLQHAHSFLKPNGKLVVAIENQLGLKYFAGAPEDHLGLPMYGIEGRYREDQPQTFGRKQLEGLIKQAGFKSYKSLAPFPDYKLPLSIVTERGFLCNEFDAAAFAWQSVCRDPQIPPIIAFSPELVWPTLVNNELALDLSNSLLILASQAEGETLVSNNALAWHYSTGRKKELCKSAEFVKKENNEIEIFYKRLDTCAPNPFLGDLLQHHLLVKDEYRRGNVYSQDFIKIVTRDDWHIEDFCNLLRNWLKFIAKLSAEQGQNVDIANPASQLPGNLFDCIPQNIILSNDGVLHFFDNEWVINEKLEISYLAIRSMWSLLHTVKKFGKPQDKNIKTFYDFIIFSMNGIGWSISDEELKSWIGIESKIQSEIAGRSVFFGGDVDSLKQTSLQISNLSQVVATQDGQISGFKYTLSERDSQIVSLTHQIVNLSQVVAARDIQISGLNQALTERDIQIISFTDKLANLSQVIAERDGQMPRLNQALAERDTLIASLTQKSRYQFIQIESILQSYSWRLTKPLRTVGRWFLFAPKPFFREHWSEHTLRFLSHLPVSDASKNKFKNAVFHRLPFLFNRTIAYHTWAQYQKYENKVNFPGLDASQHNNVQEPVVHVPLLNAKPLTERPAKLICFYLPQFHVFPENDEWWGKGFTEWTNVVPAQPQFEGHYQPHVSSELGNYNLLNPAVQRRQAELAKLYGIEGFCFYFYWFAGHRLMEQPIRNFMEDDEIDLPFCLCWANENWSRRWDGLDSDILIAQEHSAEDDLAFIAHIAEYLKSPRYIRVDGKPLLLVYRPSLLPSARQTVQRWREWCRYNGIGEIYLAYTQSFELEDPAKYGFDAAIEFPPNNSSPPNITDRVVPLHENFTGTVYDWRIFVERSERYVKPNYQLYRSVCPSWDNTARRKNNSTIFKNSSPDLYQKWLKNAINYTVENNPEPDKRLIFVNAWNEWAEGAHLEPDERYGYAWLQATRNALSGERTLPVTRRKVILVAHDAYPHGAQMLAANLAKTLSQGMGFHVDLICLGVGPLLDEYAKWSTVHLLAGKDPHGSEANALAQSLYDAGHRSALVNTTVSGLFLETLVGHHIECVALIHELRGVIEQCRLHNHAESIAAHATKVVFPAAEVAKSFSEIAPVLQSNLVIRPQGLYKRRDKSLSVNSNRTRLRQYLDLAKDTQIVLGVGYADHRKGVDLFVAAGIAMANRLPNARWVWIGHWEQAMQETVDKQLALLPEHRTRFIFPGLQQDTDMFYGGADVFALTSREDPFPSVVLEAMDSSLPVVGFENAGGFIGLVRDGGGLLVEKENATAFGEAVATLLEQVEVRLAAGAKSERVVSERFSFRHYVFDLLDLLGYQLDRISVVVPSYNYAHYLPERLNSILRQDYPIFEILFLDDKSKDNSCELAHEILSRQSIDYRIVANEENSGSVFKQWKKGVDLARGTHVWIAESDDSSADNFISETRKGFQISEVVLSYCESKQIDETGHLLANNYLAYVSDIDEKLWRSGFVMDGHEAAKSLCIKNIIPNVSAVLFKAETLRSVLELHIDHILNYRVAGDWLVYVLLLQQGRLAFTPQPANSHRRHVNSVTLSAFNSSQLKEIRDIQSFVAKEFQLSAEQTAQATAYAEKLAEQFGLASI
jgi:SAM-dependent methyltransferase